MTWRVALDLERESVTCFSTENSKTMIMGGGFAWWLITLAMYGVNCAATVIEWPDNGYDMVIGLLACLTGSHVVVGGAMLVDMMYFNERLWPLTAVIMIGQMYSALALASILGYSFSVNDTHRGGRISLNAFNLFAQVVYIGSSRAVATEYAARRLA